MVEVVLAVVINSTRLKSVNVMEGTGKLELTGNLGDVMKESAHAAVSCIRSRAAQLGIDPEFYKNRDIHIHLVSMVSAGTNRSASRTTGSISAKSRRFSLGISTVVMPFRFAAILIRWNLSAPL